MTIATMLATMGRSIPSAFSRAANFLARLSFWRFVALCILLMIAAGIASNLFEPQQRHRTVVNINQDAPKAPRPMSPPKSATGFPSIDESAGKTPDTAPLPVPPENLPPDAGDKDVEVRIDENSIVIKGINSGKDLEKIGKAIEKKIDRKVAKELEKAALDAGEGVERSFSFGNLAMLLIVIMIITRMVSKSKVKAEQRAATAESAADSAALSRQLAEAKLQAMQAQVEPHFLFNTLGAVEHLIETDPPRAAEMQRHLIAYLRSVLPNLRQSDSTLGREADIARNYLEILTFRMESRLSYTIDIPAGLETAAMPPLMLQSLVENAIQHGLEPKPEGGHITITASMRDGQLIISVADTGMGINSTAGKRPGGGVGLTSIRERLAALFDGSAKLSIEANDPCGTRVTLEFPYAYKRPDTSTNR